MGSLVPLQVTRIGESLVTQGTGKDNISCMDHLMYPDFLKCEKILGTEDAGKYLSYMSLLVTIPVARIGERLATLRTGIWLYSCMNHHVCLQVTRLGERLATLRTGNGLIVCMCPLVFLQIIRPGERIWTV